MTAAGMNQKDECKRTADEVSKCLTVSIKTEGLAELRDKSRGNLFTAWMVLGIKAA